MTMKRWDGAAQVDLTTAKRWDGAAFVTLTVAKRWDGAAWVDITLPGGGGGPLSVVASPGDAYGIAIGTTLAGPVTSNAVTLTATGGTAPYTYLWELVSGDSAVIPDSPNSASTTFSAVVYHNQTKEAVYRGKVTDAAAATQSVTIVVQLTYERDIGA